MPILPGRWEAWKHQIIATLLSLILASIGWCAVNLLNILGQHSIALASQSEKQVSADYAHGMLRLRVLADEGKTDALAGSIEGKLTTLDVKMNAMKSQIDHIEGMLASASPSGGSRRSASAEVYGPPVPIEPIVPPGPDR